MQQLIEKTYSNVMLFARDANLSPEIAGKYEAGTVLRSPAFLDATRRLGGLAATHRFLIVSNQMRDLSAFETGQNWGLCVALAGSRFKVLGTHHKDGRHLVILLHLPKDDSWKEFVSVSTSLDDEIVKQSIARFEAWREQEPFPELTADEWLERCAWPVGLDGDGDPLPIYGDADESDAGYGPAVSVKDVPPVVADDDEISLQKAAALVDTVKTYSEAGDFAKAHAAFDSMRGLGESEAVCFERVKAAAVLAAAHIMAGRLTEARTLFDGMVALSRHDAALKIYAQLAMNLAIAYRKAADPVEVRTLFDMSAAFGESGPVREFRAQTAVVLVAAYGDAGSFDEARAVFENMPAPDDSEPLRESNARAAAILTILYTDSGKFAEAHALFDRLRVFRGPVAGEMCAIAAVNLINAYCGAKKPDEAQAVFDAMRSLDDSDAVSALRAEAQGILNAHRKPKGKFSGFLQRLGLR